MNMILKRTPHNSPMTLAVLVTAVMAISAIAATVQASEVQVPRAKSLAAHPIAWVQGDRCHIRGAVWMHGPRAGVPVEILDGTRTWRATTDAKGIYALSIPYAGRDLALIERPATPILVRTRKPITASVAKPALLCSRALTQRLFPSANRSNHP